jgi:hypothetical protein
LYPSSCLEFFGRLMTVSMVSLLMLWCFSLLPQHCQGNQQNSHTHAKPWPLGRSTNSACVLVKLCS